jgi:hypothetical protein
MKDIPYILQYDFGYFIAYKPKNPTPYISVSHKGIANGLSDIPNDGADFGPDSYSPTSTANPPYSESGGIKEAEQYAYQNLILIDTNNTYYTCPEIRILPGYFNYPNTNLVLFSEPVPLALGGSWLPNFSLVSEAYGATYTNTYLNFASITIGNPSYQEMHSGGFKIVGLNLNNGTFSIAFNNSFNVNNIIDKLNTGNGATFDLSGLTNVAHLEMNNIFNYGGDIYMPGAYIAHSNDIATHATIFFPNTIRLSTTTMGTGSMGPNASGIEVIVDASIWSALYGGITNNIPSGGTANMQIHAGTMELSNGTSSSPETFWNGFGSSYGTMNLRFSVDHMILNGYYDFTLPSSGLNLLEWHVGDLYNKSGQSLSTCFWLSTTSGTTAGTVFMDTKDYSPNYKKVVIQVSGYENDSTTDQTIDFPMAFSTSAAISGNNTGLTVSASTSGITITAPDSTSTYTGVIIVEGW